MFSIVHSIWANELHRQCASVRRRAARDHSWSDNLSDFLDTKPHTQLMHREIINAVERLPDSQREVMLLVAVEGFTFEQAADVLNVPAREVMKRLSQARQTIGAQGIGRKLKAAAPAS
jgi:RNA polymerase sigma-70 factor (ECF subfamily)